MVLSRLSSLSVLMPVVIFPQVQVCISLWWISWGHDAGQAWFPFWLHLTTCLFFRLGNGFQDHYFIFEEMKMRVTGLQFSPFFSSTLKIVAFFPSPGTLPFAITFQRWKRRASQHQPANDHYQSQMHPINMSQEFLSRFSSTKGGSPLLQPFPTAWGAIHS